MRLAPTYNRRTARTRRALLSAFSELIFTAGYDHITVRDVIERAQVGRSTFYEHFEDKEDVLRQSAAPVLDVLAATVTGGEPPTALEAVIAHFDTGGRWVRAFFDGDARRSIARHLAALIEERLTGMRDAVPAIPPAMVSMQLAESQLGLIQSWLDDPGRCSAATVATALASSTRAAAEALLRSPAQRTRETSISRAALTAAVNAARR